MIEDAALRLQAAGDKECQDLMTMTDYVRLIDDLQVLAEFVLIVIRDGGDDERQTN